ncbi:hypothetical protein ACFL2H_13700, partial [Planctomycetota bacterium]
TGNQSEYVVDRPCYRARDANLRTQLGKILARAGIPSFHRPFDNFRASASTDLATIYPIKTAADWLGHSVQTALKYYHMSRDQDLTKRLVPVFKQAIGADNVTEGEPSMGGEDFSRYGKAGVPILMFRLGTVESSRLKRYRQIGILAPILHSSKYYPDPEPTLKTSIAAMASAAMELMPPQTNN